MGPAPVAYVPSNLELFILVGFAIVAMLWALPANCQDVPGPVRFLSDFAKNLAVTSFKLLAFAVLVVILALGVLVTLTLAGFWLAVCAVHFLFITIFR